MYENGNKQKWEKKKMSTNGKIIDHNFILQHELNEN